MGVESRAKAKVGREVYQNRMNALGMNRVLILIVPVCLLYILRVGFSVVIVEAKRMYMGCERAIAKWVDTQHGTRTMGRLIHIAHDGGVEGQTWFALALNGTTQGHASPISAFDITKPGRKHQQVGKKK
jgi:hypothetical protein